MNQQVLPHDQTDIIFDIPSYKEEYKILITTCCFAEGGVSVSTQVVEFASREAAEMAAYQIGEYADCDKCGYSQTVLLLFRI